MTDNELKEDVKNKLKMYNPYTNRIIQMTLEIESIQARIFEDSAGSFPTIPEGTTTPDIHRKSPLWDEIYSLEEEIGKYSPTIDQVNNFLDKLNSKEKDIIRKLYLDKKPLTQKQVGLIYGYEREGIRNKVDRTIIKHWEY